MAAMPPNEMVLDELRQGFAQFELVTSPVASVSASSYRPHQRGNPFAVFPGVIGHQFFARIGSSLDGGSPALKKVERYSLQKITGDGRCMFRALREDSKPDHMDISADVKYISWLNEHPSALSSFQEMMDAAKGKWVVVFLDYDGTLSPIVNDPERAFMSDLMRSAVRDVAKLYPTAIISGRNRQKVYGFVKLDDVFYAGSHGMDIMGPAIQASCYDGKYQSKVLDKKGNELTVFQPAQDFLPSIEKMLNELEEKTLEINGALVEDNRFCISVHYRHVLQEDLGLLEKKVQAIVAMYPGFHVTRGKKVLEICPSIKWNKGNALLYLLETLGFTNSSDVLPIYIGDDKTDEDAFKVRGMAFNKGVKLHPRDERDDADELRMAVKEAICDDEKERLKYEDALVAITVEESLRRYCQRIGRSDFWGGESELLVLSKLCCQPIMVYIPEQEHGGRGSGFIPIAEYGAEFRKGSKNRKARKAVRLLYSGRNHYDLLV